MGHHQVGSLLHEIAVPGHPSRAGQLEIDAHMHTALTEMSIRQSLQAVARHQGLEFAQVAGQLRRRHGGVLPAGMGRLGQTDRGKSSPVGADLP